jgi:hypothetical protein
MPVAKSHMLQPGESLFPGECLVSEDGRFRLFLEEDGYVAAYAYLDDIILRYWESQFHRGAGTRLGFNDQPNNGHFATLELVIYDSNGDKGYIFPEFTNYPNGWTNLEFRMQDDGNVVHYVRNPATGEVAALWAAGCNNRHFMVRDAIIPNAPILEIPIAGAISSDTQTNAGGNTDIVNKSNSPVAVRDNDRIVSIPPNKGISANLPGSLDVQTVNYSFADLRDLIRQRRPSELDSSARTPNVPGGSRSIIEIGQGGSLSLSLV